MQHDTFLGRKNNQKRNSNSKYGDLDVLSKFYHAYLLFDQFLSFVGKDLSIKSTSQPSCLFLWQPRKDDDVDGVDEGTAVIDGELEVLLVKMFISFYSVVHKN